MEKTDEKQVVGNKRIIKIFGNILFTIFMVIMAGLIFITAQSRFTGEEPALLGHKLYIVNSGSMGPTIKVDSMIVVKELEAKDIKNKDIVTYYGKDLSSRVTHRVVEVQDEGKSFITKGDANTTNDPIPLDGSQIIGKVVFVIPLLGWLFRYISSTEGIITLLIIMILWTIIPRLFSKKNLDKKDSKQLVKLDDPKEISK